MNRFRLTDYDDSFTDTYVSPLYPMPAPAADVVLQLAELNSGERLKCQIEYISGFQNSLNV